MTCAECEPLIGALADGELSPVQADAVSSHLANCPACGAVLVTIRELGNAVRKLPVSSPPADLWNAIADQIAPEPVAGRIRPGRRIPWLRIASVAALILIAVYTGWLAYGPDRRPNDPSVPSFVDLSPILENGIPVNFNPGDEFKFVAAPLDKARQQVNFTVFDQPQLAEGYEAKGCKVGCCGMHTIMQTEYRSAKERCMMFQYPRDLPVSFGEAPVEQVKVGDKSVRLVQGKACWAASWQRNGTAVTIVGQLDRDELLHLVAKVEHSMERETP